MDKIYEIMDRAKNNTQNNIEIGRNHLFDNNETYFSHLSRSWGYAFDFFICSNKAIIHGIFPCFYITSTTDLTKKLYNDLNLDKKE